MTEGLIVEAITIISELNVCTAHLFQCLMSSVFCVFIYKSGDAFRARNIL